MNNKLPCGKCQLYDVILKSGEKPSKRGWCTQRSKYPAEEGPGQLFPAGVQRVGPGQLAEPFIVREEQVVTSCTFVREAAYNTTEHKQQRLVNDSKDRKGNRILS